MKGGLMLAIKTETISFGKLLKTLRERASLTQEALEQKTGLNRSYIAQLESGHKKSPSNRTLLRLAEGLEVDYDKLLKASGYFVNLQEKNSLPALQVYLKTIDQLGISLSETLNETPRQSSTTPSFFQHRGAFGMTRNERQKAKRSFEEFKKIARMTTQEGD